MSYWWFLPFDFTGKPWFHSLLKNDMEGCVTKYSQIFMRQGQTFCHFLTTVKRVAISTKHDDKSWVAFGIPYCVLDNFGSSIIKAIKRFFSLSLHVKSSTVHLSDAKIALIMKVPTVFVLKCPCNLLTINQYECFRAIRTVF